MLVMKALVPASGRFWNAVAGLLLLAAVATPASAQNRQDLRSFSLEELGSIEVTTVSRSPESQAHVPAAVYVITQDDIRRSGATSIPAALRLAPGVQVAQRDSTHWAVGIRGLAGPLTRSVLVLIDGRAVYDPLFAGTYWDVQDTLLSDIDRIEVIRGPGGTLWGANAINGIINIITKVTRDTQGSIVTAQGGSAEYGAAGFRYGGTKDSTSYRVYGQTRHRGPAFHANGQDDESWLSGQGGFRVDDTLASGRMLTVQGDVYKARSHQLATYTSYGSPFTTVAPFDAPISGGNALLRWSSADAAKAPFQLQTYYDRRTRDEVPVKESRDTFDVDLQQTWNAWPRQELVWGLAYRRTTGRIIAVAPAVFSPAARTDHLSSGFVQETITLVPERVRLSGGVKLEHNSYSGFELQPSGRIVWTPNVANTLFGSITRAVRTPAPVETDFTSAGFSGVSQGLGIFVRLQPNPAFESEKLTAYELGYRVQPVTSAYVTVSSFFNQLDDVESVELLTPFLEVTPAPPHLILPIRFANGLHGSSYGAEITADVRPAPWWRVTANYSYVRVALSETAGNTDISAEALGEGSSPRHQWQARSSFDLHGGWSADWFLRGASALASGPVPGYTTSNARIARQITPRLELAVAGENLHQAHHREWSGGVEARRNAHVTATWRW